MKSYNDYRQALDISVREIRGLFTRKDYQSFSELIKDLEESLKTAKQLDKELSR